MRGVSRGRPSPWLAGVAGLVVATTVAVPAARGQEPEATAGPSMTLAGALTRALDLNPLVRAFQLDVDRAAVDLAQWQTFAALPQIQFDALTGIVPEARGDALFSPNSADALKNFGPFFKAQVGFAMPIYGFGRLKHGTEAARRAVDARASVRDRTRDEVAIEVVRAYIGTVAGDDLLEVAREMRDAYDDLLGRADEKLEADDIDPNDVWEIRAARYDIDQLYFDSVEGRNLVADALARLVGVDPASGLRVVAAELPEVMLTRDDLATLQAVAAARNPQIQALAATADALDSAAEFERAERLPLFVLGGGLGIARSSARDDQTNPFVVDEFNYNRLVAAVNVKWDLNFTRHRLDYLRRRIERDATDARRKAVELKVGLDAERALERVIKNVELLESARTTRRDTRRWLRAAGDEFDLGIGETQPLIKAYRADYRLQATVIQRQYELHVSLAELALVMGDLHSYLTWIADGHVSLE